jgi:hypothetical protein
MYMIDLTREVLAYGIIVSVAVVSAPAIIVIARRRRRAKLRRRGIKTYGH